MLLWLITDPCHLSESESDSSHGRCSERCRARSFWSSVHFVGSLELSFWNCRVEDVSRRLLNHLVSFCSHFVIVRYFTIYYLWCCSFPWFCAAVRCESSLILLVVLSVWWRSVSHLRGINEVFHIVSYCLVLFPVLSFCILSCHLVSYRTLCAEFLK